MSGVRLVLDMPDVEYHAHPALSSTGARALLPPSCPAIFRYDRDNGGRADTDAFDEGRAAHTLALGVGMPIERLEFNDRRTNAYKAAEKEAREAGRVPLLAHVHDRVLAMRDQLQVEAGYLFTGEGHPEASVFWHDEEFEVDCRARFDWLPTKDEGGRRVVVVDYKTAESNDPFSFSKSAARFGYHMQDAWYRAAAWQLYAVDVAFVFVVQSKKPPYLVQAYQLTEDAVALGHNRNRQALEVFAECTAVGQWPGFSTSGEVEIIDLPRWAYL